MDRVGMVPPKASRLKRDWIPLNTPATELPMISTLSGEAVILRVYPSGLSVSEAFPIFSCMTLFEVDFRFLTFVPLIDSKKKLIDQFESKINKILNIMFHTFTSIAFLEVKLCGFRSHYVAEILLIRRKIPINQSINQSINPSYFADIWRRRRAL